jgi:hypothetical protein
VKEKGYTFKFCKKQYLKTDFQNPNKMTAKNYFIADAIISLIFGVVLTFIPDYLAKLYLTNPSWLNEGAKVVAECFGTLNISFAVAYWSARNAGPSRGRRALLIVGFFANLFLVIVTAKAIFSNVETNAAWATVVQTLAFTAWSGLLLMKEPESEA